MCTPGYARLYIQIMNIAFADNFANGRMGEYDLSVRRKRAVLFATIARSAVDDFGSVRAYHVNAEDFVVLASVDYLDDTVAAFVFRLCSVRCI